MLIVKAHSPHANRGWGFFKKAGRLAAVSTLLLSGAASASFAGNYPEVATPAQSVSIVRSCTQLEATAHILKGECGTLTLSEVVRRMNALTGDDRDY